MHGGDLTVVKLGGSHLASSHLNDLLDVVASCRGHVILVPGGGIFADAVRRAQAQLGFDDQAAHRMALLAMEQFGLLLSGLRAGLRVTRSPAEIQNALNSGAVPVWSPAEMVLQANEIPASWDVTSDSLAAWLAGQIGAPRLILLKHGDWSQESVLVADLVKEGVVDKAFSHFLPASGAQGSVAGVGAHAAMATAVRAGMLIGARIDLREPDARGLLPPCQRSKHRGGDGL